LLRFELGGKIIYASYSERNGGVLERAKELKNVVRTVKGGEPNWIGQVWHTNCLQKQVIEGKIEGRIEGTGRRGRRRSQPRNNPKENRKYRKLRGSTSCHSVEN
jgi:hypothetical protein